MASPLPLGQSPDRTTWRRGRLPGLSAALLNLASDLLHKATQSGPVTVTPHAWKPSGLSHSRAALSRHGCRRHGLSGHSASSCFPVRGCVTWSSLLDFSELRDRTETTVILVETTDQGFIVCQTLCPALSITPPTHARPITRRGGRCSWAHWQIRKSGSVAGEPLARGHTPHRGRARLGSCLSPERSQTWGPHRTLFRVAEGYSVAVHSEAPAWCRGTQGSLVKGWLSLTLCLSPRPAVSVHL